ncbi:Hypothetical predicted protein [Olea europaea subsp. europaea]|uniref:Uncharacterized protein n=1 Tax=Olea europaea subsp. europaea TaxID=158383 RepID=A0A8S0Q7Y2_OLEEU|nr:Hypothetical predicted protein [Olea europaea subsp. europaea]
MAQRADKHDMMFGSNPGLPCATLKMAQRADKHDMMFGSNPGLPCATLKMAHRADKHDMMFGSNPGLPCATLKMAQRADKHDMMFGSNPGLRCAICKKCSACLGLSHAACSPARSHVREHLRTPYWGSSTYMQIDVAENPSTRLSLHDTGRNNHCMLTGSKQYHMNDVSEEESNSARKQRRKCAVHCDRYHSIRKSNPRRYHLNGKFIRYILEGRDLLGGEGGAELDLQPPPRGEFWAVLSLAQNWLRAAV